MVCTEACIDLHVFVSVGLPTREGRKRPLWWEIWCHDQPSFHMPAERGWSIEIHPSHFQTQPSPSYEVRLRMNAWGNNTKTRHLSQFFFFFLYSLFFSLFRCLCHSLFLCHPLSCHTLVCVAMSSWLPRTHNSSLGVFDVYKHVSRSLGIQVVFARSLSLPSCLFSLLGSPPDCLPVCLSFPFNVVSMYRLHRHGIPVHSAP